MNKMTDSSLHRATWRQLKTFVTVAKLGSVSEAAKELHITQPAVSMQLRDLESHCGIALYERIGRRIELTDAGREMANCGRAVAEQMRQTEELFAQMRGLKRGVLRLDTVSTAKYFAPSLLASFQQGHPDITIRFAVGNREDMVRHLSDNDCDLVIMGRPPNEIDVEAVPFASHPLVFVASSKHALARRRRIPLTALAAESLLIREPGSGTRAAMEELFATGGVTFTASMEVSSNETIKQAVLAGMGIAFLSAHTIASEVQTGRLVILKVVGMPVMRQWHVVHRAGKRLSPVATAFRAFVIERGQRIIDEMGIAGF